MAFTLDNNFGGTDGETSDYVGKYTGAKLIDLGERVMTDGNEWYGYARTLHNCSHTARRLRTGLRSMLVLLVFCLGISFGTEVRADAPHLILVSMDTTRADALSCYGTLLKSAFDSSSDTDFRRCVSLGCALRCIRMRRPH